MDKNEKIALLLRHYFFLSRELWYNMDEDCEWICNLYLMELYAMRGI